ncbi:BLUF domain-containing protein [Mucilaginibacter lacusdianchii]|uniref:BLUF domain-containing protein n=1 Tax=Mucilaginibacter lacusdianchii TaxID=2684211 RepID=UPI00131D09CD|nr:BLUF domain-containing protein [Mucilaginibacter sp. JXJ CY 39]
MIYNVIYISKVMNLMQEDDLIALLKQSRDWNNDHGITGILVYIEGQLSTHTEGRFMQSLEGSQFEVERIFEKIQRDQRHHCLTVLKHSFIDNRNFGEWQMGFEYINLQKHQELTSFFTLDDEILKSEEFEASDAALNFLKAFYRVNKKSVF